jgi:hypothetical protein
MQNARCKNKKLQIAAADSRADPKICKMQIARKIFSADIILQIAIQIWPQKVFDIKISTPGLDSSLEDLSPRRFQAFDTLFCLQKSRDRNIATKPNKIRLCAY